MTAKVRIPTQLRTLTGGAPEVDGHGATLTELLHDLDGRYPGFSARVLNDGQLHRFVNVYVNGEDVRFLEGATTRVPEQAEISIIPAVAGGAPGPA